MVIAAGFAQEAITEFSEAPFAVVEVREGGEGGNEFLAIFVGVAINELLLGGAIEAFDRAVDLEFADKGKAGGKAMEAVLPLEVGGEVLAAVVVAQLDIAGGVGLGGAKGAVYRLGDEFVGGEMVAARAGVAAEQLGVPVPGDGENPQPSVHARPNLRPFGRAAHVGRGGVDAAVARLGGNGDAAMRRKAAGAGVSNGGRGCGRPDGPRRNAADRRPCGGLRP